MSLAEGAWARIHGNVGNGYYDLVVSRQERIFQQLAEEKASGQLFTLRDWLAQHPPSPDAFKQTIAGAAALIRNGEPFPYPVRDFLDEFVLLPGRELRQRAIEERPLATEDRRYDAYLAALAEHLAATHSLKRPSWVCEPRRFLGEFWFPSEVSGFRALSIAESPAAFRRRGIFISAASLQRV